MANPSDYGHHVGDLRVEVYRDSAFVERRAVEGIKLVSAWFLFPTRAPAVKWTAVVTGDGVAEWAIPADQVALAQADEWVELWYNGVCWKKGTVLRRGDLT